MRHPVTSGTVARRAPSVGAGPVGVTGDAYPGPMAFGQAAGPPASPRRIVELAELLAARGYDSFKEARHPFGLTQRQAAGRFTVGEADEFLARLEGEADLDPGPGAQAAGGSPTGGEARRRAREEELVVGLSAEVLATELTNRGWCCIAPPD